MTPEIDALAAQADAILRDGAVRLRRTMPFLVRWRDRLVYSIVLGCGAGAIVSIWEWSWGLGLILPGILLFFLLFRGYDRADEQTPEFTAAERKELVRIAAAISRLARPADEPEFPYWRPRRPTLVDGSCGWCSKSGKVYAGPFPPFASADRGVEAACADCLRAGRAALQVSEGELVALRNSIATRTPGLASGDLDQRVRAAAEELRRTPAPPLRVDWPQCCADFCRFEGAWDIGDFAVACGSFDTEVLAGYVDHAAGRAVPRSATEQDAHADQLVSLGWMWQVFRCRSCSHLSAAPMAWG